MKNFCRIVTFLFSLALFAMATPVFAETGKCEGGYNVGTNCSLPSQCKDACQGGYNPGTMCGTGSIQCQGACTLTGYECYPAKKCQGKDTCVKGKNKCKISGDDCKFPADCDKVDECKYGECTDIGRCMKDGKELLVTLSDDALKAEAVDGQVKLTLTTSTEDNVAKIFIYRGVEVLEEVLEVKQVCGLDSEGNKISGKTYECIDEDVPAKTYQYWPASVDYNATCIDCITHYLDKKVEITVK